MPAPLDELSARYERHHAADRNAGEFVFVPERIPFIQRALGAPGKRILDLGCRSGALTRHFLDGNQVVGVDVDRVALEAASQLGIETMLADIEQPLPFPDEDFDAVVAGELLEHVRFPDNVVAEAVRVLRPGGVLVGSVPNIYRLRSRLFFLAGRPPDNDPTHLHMFSPTSLRELLSGLTDVEIGFFGGRFRPLSKRLHSVDMTFRGVRS
jgi:SAM-dependent methyltransferase